MGAPLALIIGVGPGIGHAVARRFAKEGMDLALVSLDLRGLESIRDALAPLGVEIRLHACDASDGLALSAVFAAIREQGSPLEVLVYNASAMTEAPPSALDPAVLVRDFGSNCLGALMAAQQAIPEMRRRGRGTILFTGGGLALKPSIAVASASIGKGALRTLALMLAEELEPEGIHAATVTVAGFVQPGTPFDPATLAETYWALHREAPGCWTREVVIR